MAGAQISSLTALEEKARKYHLSESKIKQEHKAILKLLLPPNVVEKLKVCTGKEWQVSSSWTAYSTINAHISIEERGGK